MDRVKSEDAIADKGRPFTGAEYLESLRDGREVYVYGERVKDVTTHPAFRNAARSIARLYDALHDEKTKSAADLSDRHRLVGLHPQIFPRRAFARGFGCAARRHRAWARMSYGWMGRSPDYKASLMNTLGANYDFYGKFADNAKRWYRRAQENVLFMNHAIVNPPVDRSKPVDQVKDVFITIQKDTDAGIYISGAKVVATASALTHYNFLGQNAAVPLHDTDLAVMFIAPMNAPGVKLFCRTSYEMTASVMGTPFDYPLSSRFDENDAIFVFDNVFIPWEDVLLHRDLEKLKVFFPQSGFLAGYQFQGCTRLAVKLDFLAGVLAKALHAAGSDEFRGNQAMLGEVIAWRNLFWALDRRHGDESDAVGQRRGAAEPAVGVELSRVRRRRLRARQGDRRQDRRLVADLSAVLHQGFQKSGDRPLSGALRARLLRHRLQGAHQDHEASVGRHRHRIRRPPRALRAQLRRQSRGYPHPGAVECARVRNHRRR